MTALVSLNRSAVEGLKSLR